MSNDKITIIPPEGYQPVFNDDGTVTFEVADAPAGIEALSLDWSTSHLYRYEVWSGTKSGWEPRAAVIDPALYADNPQYRNFTPQVTLQVVIAHPSQRWVDEARGLLEDYLSEHLASITADEIYAADRRDGNV